MRGGESAVACHVLTVVEGDYEVSTMTCRKCGGSIEYETERVSNGDGVWAESGYVGIVHWEVVSVRWLKIVPNGNPI